MSAKAGWYPDPGGGQGLYRYWDGKAWSAATSPHPGAPAPGQGFPGAAQPPVSGAPAAGSGGQAYGQYGGYGQGSYGGQPGYGQYGGQPTGSQPGYGSAYATYQQQTQRKRGRAGWWIAGGALVIVIVVVAVIAIRALAGGGAGGGTGLPGGQGTQDVCPPQRTATPSPDRNDGRVHGGPLSYPTLGAPWTPPDVEIRVPFGVDVKSQTVPVEPSYKPNSDWVASILVGELQAGDGFFTPEQGSAIVVKCILGAFYDNAPVTSDVKRNEATTVDGHEAWIVESQLSFDIPDLKTKGELLIVVIVAAGQRSGLYYASIPDTVPELVKPARDALKGLTVEE